MKYKLYSWSHGAECWIYYDSSDSEEEADRFIKDKGFDPKYFRGER